MYNTHPKLCYKILGKKSAYYTRDFTVVTGVEVTIGNCFPQWEILPSAFGVRQYFPNFGETVFNASVCLYDLDDIDEW